VSDYELMKECGKDMRIAPSWIVLIEPLHVSLVEVDEFTDAGHES